MRAVFLLLLGTLALAGCGDLAAPKLNAVYVLDTVDGGALPFIISSDEHGNEFRLMSMRYEISAPTYTMFARLEFEDESGVNVWEVDGDGTVLITGDTVRFRTGSKGWAAAPEEPVLAFLNGDRMVTKLAYRHEAVFVRR